MAAIVSTVEVAGTPDEVFAYVVDPDRFPEWQAGVVDGQLEGETAEVGAKCTTTRRIGGRERTVVSELVRLDPPRAWGVRGTDGPIRAAVDVTVEPVPGRRACTVRIDVDFEGHGIGKVLVPLLVRPQSRREMRGNMARLKQRLDDAAGSASDDRDAAG
ncbi:SRPBCC family protein [Kribbella sp. CA-253562]|uniref:SRPBCC family protein n=1 Tax=Kribbella sp. CA-253562 TaxID=3239942 RepID=UPI003D940AD1